MKVKTVELKQHPIASLPDETLETKLHSLSEAHRYEFSNKNIESAGHKKFPNRLS